MKDVTFSSSFAAQDVGHPLLDVVRCGEVYVGVCVCVCVIGLAVMRQREMHAGKSL